MCFETSLVNINVGLETTRYGIYRIRLIMDYSSLKFSKVAAGTLLVKRFTKQLT